MMRKPVLYMNKKDCCGCGACINICPRRAIELKEDAYGFVYPDIDNKKCINCGLCGQVCNYHKKEECINKQETYVAAAMQDRVLEKAASGGVFSVLAENLLKDNSVVFGCAMKKSEKELSAVHIKAENRNELIKLQGSKYFQSDIGMTYSQAKEELDKGKKVLFSGTPCQIAGLKGFLQRDYDNLITIDLICHGVPSRRMFSDYIKLLEKKYKAEISEVVFRDKKKGWSLDGRISFADIKGKTRNKVFSSRESSFYTFFQKGVIYRENCYTCPYAGGKRAADITIGDYWGINKEHPELLHVNGGKFREDKGISCVILHSEKGKDFFERYSEGLQWSQSSFEKAARGNMQLREPTEYDPLRDEILEKYREMGYEAVEKYFKKIYRSKLIVIKVKRVIKKPAKQILKKLKSDRV